MSKELRPGTRVRLPDGTVAFTTPDRRVGYVWDGTYRTAQPIPGTDRIRYGWRREFLTVLDAQGEAQC